MIYFVLPAGNLNLHKMNQAGACKENFGTYQICSRLQFATEIKVRTKQGNALRKYLILWGENRTENPKGSATLQDT